MDPQFKFGRDYDFHELLADGIIHAIGIAFALIGTVFLILNANLSASGGEQAAAWIYCIGLITALTISFIYNMLPVSPVKWQLRRLDHSAIFILIAATYTPFLQRGADDPMIFALLIGIWLVAAAGVALKCLMPGRHDRLAIGLYLLMGWSGLLVVGPISSHVPAVSMLLIVIGGVIYSTGVIFHVWRRLRFQNAIWHAFVVAAAAIYYSAVFTAFRSVGM